MTLTEWTSVIKDTFKSKNSKTAIAKEIKEKCLVSEVKWLGSYRINDELIWENILLKDDDYRTALEIRRIRDIIAFHSWYVECDYQRMHGSYRGCRHKV